MDLNKIVTDKSSKWCAYTILISTTITAFFGYTINATPVFKFFIAAFCWLGIFFSVRRRSFLREYPMIGRWCTISLMLMVIYALGHSMLSGQTYAGEKYVVIFTNKVAVLDLVGVFFMTSIVFIEDLRYLLKASLLFAIFSVPLLIFNFETTAESYFLGYVLLYTPVFLPYIKKKYIIIFLIAYTISLYAFFGGGRQMGLLLAFAVLSFVAPLMVNKKYVYLGSLFICITPIVLLVWSIYNVSIFDFLSGNYSGHDSEIAVDTRTFLWVELSSDLFRQDWATILFGKGVLGFYESGFFGMDHRFAIEVPVLQWVLQAGLVYVFLFTILVFSAIVQLFRKGNNMMCQIASLLIAGFYFNCFVSNLLGCQIGTLGIWVLISIAFNPILLNATDDDLRDILSKVKLLS